MAHAAELDFWKRLFYQPYGRLVPWIGLVVVLALAWVGLHALAIDRCRSERVGLERERTDARQQLNRHAEARQARKDMAHVLATLPAQRDFAPLALGLTEQAKTNHVQIPGLTYHVEKTDVHHVAKAVLQGAATGRYEDIRRFIHNLETAEELLLIENLDVDRTRRPDQTLTVNLRIVTYLRIAPDTAARS